jgi:transcriptional regulator with XRE-family HTH domain
MMGAVDEWRWRAALARRRLTARFAAEGRPYPRFCAALVVARGERGLSVEEMAAELGCGPATLRALEEGLLPPDRAPAAVLALVATSLGTAPEAVVAEGGWDPVAGADEAAARPRVRAWKGSQRSPADPDAGADEAAARPAVRFLWVPRASPGVSGPDEDVEGAVPRAAKHARLPVDAVLEFLAYPAVAEAPGDLASAETSPLQDAAEPPARPGGGAVQRGADEPGTKAPSAGAAGGAGDRAGRRRGRGGAGSRGGRRDAGGADPGRRSR